MAAGRGGTHRGPSGREGGVLTTLVALWNFSLALCGVALLALLALLIGRAISGARTNRRAEERRRLSRLLLEGGDIDRPDSALARTEAVRLTIELTELVRGSDREALLANAERLGVVEVLRKRLKSRTPQDRLMASEALAMFPGEAEAVTAMLDDRNPDVRLGAALALAQNHVAPPAAELVRKLGLGTTERSLLVVSLMRDLVESDPEGVEAMLYDSALPDSAKLAATDALAASGRVEHAPLVAWMADAATEDSALQPRIYRALGRIGHPGGHAAIRRGLDSPWWQARAAAAEAAGKSGMVAACDKLGELLGDPEWWVRFRAGEALSYLGRSGRNALHYALEDGSDLAREAAKQTLAERGLA